MNDTTVISAFELSRSAHVITDESNGGPIVLAVMQGTQIKQMSKDEFNLWNPISSGITGPNTRVVYFGADTNPTNSANFTYNTTTHQFNVGFGAVTDGIYTIGRVFVSTSFLQLDDTNNSAILSGGGAHTVRTLLDGANGVFQVLDGANSVYFTVSVLASTYTFNKLAGSGAQVITINNSGTVVPVTGASDTFTTADAKTVTVVGGIITNIV